MEPFMEKEITFKDLSLRGKIDHIWTYYRYFILAGIFMLFLVFMIVYQASGTRESLMDVIMLDSNATAHEAVSGFDEFLDEYGYETYEGAVAVNTNLSFYSPEEMAPMDEASKAGAETENYEKEQILFTLMAAGDTELLFGQGDIFLNYAHAGMLADLSQLLPAGLLEQYKDDLIYTDESGTTAAYPCAISLSGNEWLAENGYYKECYFGILYHADDPQIAAQFAEYLLNYK